MTWKKVQTRWYNPRVSREAEAKSLYNIPPILNGDGRGSDCLIRVTRGESLMLVGVVVRSV